MVRSTVGVDVVAAANDPWTQNKMETRAHETNVEKRGKKREKEWKCQASYIVFMSELKH